VYETENVECKRRYKRNCSVRNVKFLQTKYISIKVPIKNNPSHRLLYIKFYMYIFFLKNKIEMIKSTKKSNGKKSQYLETYFPTKNNSSHIDRSIYLKSYISTLKNKGN